MNKGEIITKAFQSHLDIWFTAFIFPPFSDSSISTDQGCKDFPNARMPNKSNYYIYVIHMASSYSADGSSHKRV